MTGVLDNELIFREIISKCSKSDALHIGMANKKLYSLYCNNLSTLVCCNVSALLCATIKFKHLVDIDCSESKVTNKVVERFPWNLKRLKINNCKFINSYLNLSRFKELESFECASTGVSQRSLSTLTSPSALQTLDISFCWNVKSSLDLTPFTQLKTLKSCGSYYVARKLAIGTNIPLSLETLDFSYSFYGDYVEIDLSRFVELKRVDCSGNWRLTNYIIDRLPSDRLEVLHMYFCLGVNTHELQLLRFTKLKEFKGDCFHGANGPNFPQTIEKLNLRDSRVKNINTFDFTNHRNLKVLVFNQCQMGNDTSMSKLPPFIEQLVIENCCQLEYIDLLKYSKLQRFMCRWTNIRRFNLPRSVEEVVLSGIKVIDNNQFDFSTCENLKIFECSNTSLTLENAGQRLPNSLRKLDISYCQLVSDAELKHCSNLQELNCGHTYFSATFLDKLPLSIEKLDISSCYHQNPNLNLSKYTSLRELTCRSWIISSETFNNLPLSLQKLDISSCSQLSDFDLSRYTNLQKVKCLRTALLTETIQRIKTFLKGTSTGDLFFR